MQTLYNTNKKDTSLKVSLYHITSVALNNLTVSTHKKVLYNGVG
ncbi:hypothetical protein SAMN04488569_10011 [Marinilactibacillus piezotolerans]|uniref:Uncharacterized protein n=1 Tax=Marinilactibacillus piezotolerans TaxID=258723 RepID=A0A1I3UI63_9LACT|nr:hypothetical protein SAMN04488569_10011 [Marinilactibacillus piezotolerans]